MTDETAQRIADALERLVRLMEQRAEADEPVDLPGLVYPPGGGEPYRA